MEAPKRVSFLQAFLYSLGNAAGLLTYNTFNSFITFFYTDTVGLPSQWVGRGWFGFGLWNAINDPLAGWLSDHTQSRFGRRTFYIRALTIPLAIAFALVWMPPLDVERDGATAVLAYFLIIISIYDILQTILTLNQDALFPEMFEDIGDRSWGASVRQIVGLGLGGGIAIAATPWVAEQFGWSGMALLWSMVAAIFYFLSLLGIRENPAYAQKAQSEGHVHPLRELRQILHNRTFLIIIAVNFVIRFVLAILGSNLLFYAKYVLRLNGGQTSLLNASLIVTATLSMLVWQFIFRRIGTRRAMLISFGAAMFLVLPFLFTTKLITTVIALTALGAVVGGSFLGPDLLFAELIDEDFVQTGLRREGVYRGALGFIYRFPPAFAGLLLGELLAVSGYDADLKVSEQPEAVEQVIRYFITVGPLAAIVAGFFLMLYYPLHGSYLAEVQAKAGTLRDELKGK